jgi:hypothetical protein
MDPKFLTIELMGGLGNQLFQIVLGYVLSKRFGLGLHINKDRFFCGQGSNPSTYVSSLYKRLQFTSAPIRIQYTYNEKQWSYYNLNNDMFELLKSQNHISVKGYWQSESHFPNMKEELRTLFDLHRPFTNIPKQIFLENPQLLEINTNACLLSVRRGDYLKHPHIHNPCGMTYYNKAISYFPKSTQFYILSDDLEWCKANFSGDQYVFLDIKNDLHTFYVGMLFPNYILSNSTFYWWMSYFSIYDSPRIIAPDKWLSLPNYHTIYRSDMIIVERPIEV